MGEKNSTESAKIRSTVTASSIGKAETASDESRLSGNCCWTA